MRLSRRSSPLIAVTKGLEVSENATTFAASVMRVASQRPNFQAALDLFSPLWPSLPSRVAEFPPVIDTAMEEPETGGIVSDIYAKHRTSIQPESQQLCAVLGAVLEVVQAEGLQPTPTTLYAALMSSLEKPETLASPQVSYQ